MTNPRPGYRGFRVGFVLTAILMIGIAVALPFGLRSVARELAEPPEGAVFTVPTPPGAAPDNVGLMIGRVAGVALLALGVACWGARTDSGGAARLGTLRAITLYNAGAGLLLVGFAATGQASGLVVWGAGAVHLALAVGFVASPRRLGDSPPAKS